MKIRLFFLLYVALNLIPFFLTNYNSTLLLNNPFLQIYEINLLLVSLPFFWGAEFFLLLFLFSFFKSKLIKCLVFFVSSILFFLVIINWFYFQSVGYFLESTSLGLLKFFGDSNLVDLVSPEEIVMLVVAIVLSLLSSYLIYSFSKNTSTKVLKSNLLSNLVILILIILSAHIFFGEKVYSQRAGFLRNHLSPRYSFLYNKLFISSELNYKILPLDQLELEPLRKLTNPEKIQYSKNIIIIIVEALRYDAFLEAMPRVLEKVSLYGNYKKGLSAGVDTDYGRTTIITGQYPLRNVSRDFRKNVNYPLISIYDCFKKLNYNTLQFSEEFSYTKLLTNTSGLDQHNDSKRYIEKDYRKYVNTDFLKDYPGVSLPSFIVDSAYVNHLNDFSKTSDKPFLANMYFYSTHFPYDFVGKYMGEPRESHPSLPKKYSFFNYGAEDASIFKKRYLNTVDFVDRQISELISNLESRGELENTLIMITGDHGEAFYDKHGVTHGREIVPQVVEVPFAFIAKGMKLDFANTCTPSHVDIYPSILDAIGAEIPVEIQGASFFTESKCEGRPKFVVSQGFEFQTGLLLNSDLLVKDSKSDKFLTSVDGRMVEVLEDSFEKEKQCLENFRNRQISYYSLSEEDLNKFAPPKFMTCF